MSDTRNINERVVVRLTDAGARLWNAAHPEERVSENGTLAAQLWELMRSLHGP